MSRRSIAARMLAAGLGLTLLALVGCAQLGGSGAQSQTLDRIVKRGELIVGTAGDMPPLNMTTKGGEVIGMEPDLAAYLAYSMNVKLRLETMAFVDLLPALEAGKIDMVLSSMTITPARNLKVAFAGPYFVSGKCVLTTNQKLAGIESAADLNAAGITMTALEGTTSQDFIQRRIPTAKLIASTNYEIAVDRVLKGDVDALLADYPICLVSLVRYPDRGLVSVITRLTYEPIGIALPAGDPLLLNFVENLLQGLALSGRLTELQERWFGQGDWLPQLP